VGAHSYALVFTTDGRRPTFIDASTVDLVRQQILRAAQQHAFAVAAYCFMPDHVHLVIDASNDDADCKRFVKTAKQLSGFYFKQARGRPLWQRYGYDRILRDEIERALTIGYVIANPVRAGLASHPSEYPYLGSERYAIDELLQICEYSGALD
jgi:putative transposase